MTRIDIIRGIAAQIGALSYLEIGVAGGGCFNAVGVRHKVGVDPDPKSVATHRMTSDEYFSQCSETFDLIFIDGLHHAGQALRDVENALGVLNPGGVIVLHDISPQSEAMQRVPREQAIWTGDVWRAWAKLRERDDLEMRGIDVDYGVGIIRRGRQEPRDFGLADYDAFDAMRSEVLG